MTVKEHNRTLYYQHSEFTWEIGSYYVTFLGMEEIARRIGFAEEIHPSSTLKMLETTREITDRSKTTLQNTF